MKKLVHILVCQIILMTVLPGASVFAAPASKAMVIHQVMTRQFKPLGMPVTVMPMQTVLLDRNPLCPYTMAQILLNYGATVNGTPGVIEFTVNKQTLLGIVTNFGLHPQSTVDDVVHLFLETYTAHVVDANPTSTSIQIDLRKEPSDPCGPDDPSSFTPSQGPQPFVDPRAPKGFTSNIIIGLIGILVLICVVGVFRLRRQAVL